MARVNNEVEKVRESEMSVQQSRRVKRIFLPISKSKNIPNWLKNMVNSNKQARTALKWIFGFCTFEIKQHVQKKRKQQNRLELFSSEFIESQFFALDVIVMNMWRAP